MVHDIANISASDILEQVEGIPDLEIGESPELLKKFCRLIRDAEKE